MLSQSFDKRIRVWVGLGFPRQLNTVADAYQFAVDWCGNIPEQKAAARACKAALVGDAEVETARVVFLAFARKKDILLENSGVPLPPGKAQSSHLDLGKAAASAAPATPHRGLLRHGYEATRS
jgi:hypothetical protein